MPRYRCSGSYVGLNNGPDWVLKACKTTKSQRVIPLVPEVVATLGDRLEAERLALGDGFTLDAFVFANGAGEPWRVDGVHKHHWQPMLKRLKLPKVCLKTLATAARRSCLRPGNR